MCFTDNNNPEGLTYIVSTWGSKQPRSMLIAALMSLSWCEPHLEQIHCLSERARSVFVFATRFCCSCPLSNLMELTMFETFELQYLNKLIESKVRDFTPPKPFHTIKVQRFGCDGVKPSAKIGGKFPIVSALVADFAIESCECLTARHIRTFDFTRYRFIELPKCVQGLFQELWALYLFTSAKR